MFPFRIGMGYDVHRLSPGLPFMLGGVKIIHHSGAVGHSDADVLLHAICDALGREEGVAAWAVAIIYKEGQTEKNLNS